MLQSTNTMFNEIIYVQIAGVQTIVHIDIRSTYRVFMTFDFNRNSYTFVVSSWEKHGLQPFLQRFHKHKMHDDVINNKPGECNNEIYGIYDKGIVKTFGEQRKMCIIQACRDIFACLEQIRATYERGVIDYAVHYLDKCDNDGEYLDYIKQLTCHNIVDTHFTNGHMTF